MNYRYPLALRSLSTIPYAAVIAGPWDCLAAVWLGWALQYVVLHWAR